ncbi:MAG TPA: FlgO family outer membrane protein [Alphaproteobacteria bacterium]|nr:FlgO family outer membrane protein [Alphaproteobacteria bacterium]
MKLHPILAATAALALAACGGYYQAEAPRSTADLYIVPADADLVQVNYAATERLVSLSSDYIDPKKTILVATLANVDNLDQSSRLGRLASEQIAARMGQMGYTVMDVNLRTSMAVNANGQFMLSRDLRQLAQQHSAQAAVVGTYAAGAREVHVNLRLVRLSDNRVISSFNYSLPKGRNTDSLLRTATSTQR